MLILSIDLTKTIINFTLIKMTYNSLHLFINVQIKPKLT